MKFLIDKKETNDGIYVPDWEFDRRLDILMAKYKFKETIIKNSLMEDIKIYTIRISNMKQMDEFIKEFGPVTVVSDCGYYFDIGCPRILIEDDKYDIQDDTHVLSDNDLIDMYIDINQKINEIIKENLQNS